MNRPLTAVFAALEAALVVAVGIGIPLAPLTVLWAVQFGFQVDWVAFWRAAGDSWLIGHGVDVAFTLPASVTSALGVDAGAAHFDVTLAALGFALLTLLLGTRAGRRVSETHHRLLGQSAAIVTFAVLALVIALTTDAAGAHAELALAVVQPTAVFAAGVIIGSLRTPRPEGDDTGSSLRDWIADWRPETREAFAAALRGTGVAVAGLVVVAALLVGVLLVAGYASIITLYESLHPGVTGGILLTLAQFALLPDAIIWAISWLVGPGFALGTGSSISPLSTSVGPLPSLPLLGALPHGDLAWGFLGLIAPVVVGFLAGIAARRRLHAPSLVRALATGVGIGLGAGLVTGLLCWFAAGSAGPGRLVDVGPDPLLNGALAALEIGVGALLGLAVASRGAAGGGLASGAGAPGSPGSAERADR